MEKNGGLSDKLRKYPRKEESSMAKRDGIYKRKDRSGYWISWIDAQGNRKYRKTDAQTLTQAINARAAELVRVEQSKVLGFAPPGEETFADIAIRFVLHQKARLSPKAFEREKGIVEKHLSRFFCVKVSAIRRVDIQRYITKRSSEVSAHSVQKEMNILKHLLRLAVEWEIIPINPAQGIKSPRVPAGRVRYLQPTELKLLIDSSPQWLIPIILLAVATGMRRSEILNVRFLDIDLAHERILLPQTKNGDGRIVYTNKIALTVLSSLSFNGETKPTDKLFSEITPSQVSVSFHRVCKKVGIEDFRFHDLRHTAASWLRMQGADIHTVAQLLGHKDLRMAARYQHLSPAFLADAVGKLDVVFGKVCYQDVTSPEVMTSGLALSATK
jgi:integrase